MFLGLSSAKATPGLLSRLHAGKSKVEIAKLLGVSRAALYNFKEEKAAITPDMALRLSKLLGGTPEIWLTMQQVYDLRTREKEIADDLNKIPTLEAAE